MWGWWIVAGLVVTFLVMVLSPHKPLNCKKWAGNVPTVRGKVLVCVEWEK